MSVNFPPLLANRHDSSSAAALLCKWPQQRCALSNEVFEMGDKLNEAETSLNTQRAEGFSFFKGNTNEILDALNISAAIVSINRIFQGKITQAEMERRRDVTFSISHPIIHTHTNTHTHK